MGSQLASSLRLEGHGSLGIANRYLRQTRDSWLVLLTYLGFAIAFTYPLILNLGAALAGHGDAWQFTWNIWWVKKAIFELGVNPFFTDYLHWPSGISLLFHSLTLANTLPAALISFFVGLAASYNIVHLASFTLTGYGAYRMCLYLTENRAASFIAGYLFTFSPFHFAHANGHFDLMATQWLPFYTLYFLKMLRQESGWLKPAIFLTLIAFTNLYYFEYAIILSVLALMFIGFAERSQLHLKKLASSLAKFALASAVFIGPLIGSMVWAKVSSHDFDVVGHDPVTYSNDLETFFVPNFASYFRDHFMHTLYRWSGRPEIAGYLGYSVLILILVGLVKYRNRMRWFWLAIAIVFAIFSMGPYLHLKGATLFNIPLPYLFAQKVIPFMTIQGVPARAMVMVYLTLAMLAAYGARALAVSQSRKVRAVLFCIFALIIVEYLPARLDVSPVVIPPFYETLAHQTDDFAMLDTSADKEKVMFYGTIHNKRLIGGYTSRPTVSTTKFLIETPLISTLMTGRDASTLTPSDARQILTRYNVRYVIIRPSDYTNAMLLERLGFETYYLDKSMRVFSSQ